MDCAMCLRPMNQEAYARRTAQAVLGAIILDGVTKPVTMTTIVRRCWRIDRQMPIRMIQQAIVKLREAGRITEAQGTYESTYKLSLVDKPTQQQLPPQDEPETTATTFAPEDDLV